MGSEMCIRDSDQEERAYRDLAARQSVDGVIVHGPLVTDARMELLSEIGLPFVVHGRTGEDGGAYSWVDIENRRAFQRATELLIDLGHRRIGLINGREEMAFTHRRRNGYEAALRARGISVDHALIRSGEMMEPYGYSSVREMLALPERPTAFLVASIIPAIGARRAIQEAGLTLGRDISVVIHDDELSYLNTGGDVPMFTATRSSVRAAGQRCAEILMDLIEGRCVGPQHELWEAQLVMGASTCLLYTSPSPRDLSTSRMPSSA